MAKNLTKREVLTAERNALAIKQGTERINSITANRDSLINLYAVKAIKALKKADRDINDSTFTSALYTLSVIIAQNKLKHMLDNEKPVDAVAISTDDKNVSPIVELKNSITAGTLNGLNAVDVALSELERLHYWRINRNNKLVFECKNNRQATAIENRIADLANCDGLELVHDVFMVLYADLVEHLSDKKLSDKLFLIGQTVPINSSMYYRNGKKKPVTLWRYTVVNSVRKAQRSVEQYVSDKRNRYNVLSLEYSITAEQDTEQERTAETDYKIYRKAYALTATDRTDYNGKHLATVVNFDEQETIERILKECRFTTTERYIVEHKMLCNKADAMTVEQLADKLKTDSDTIKTMIKRIRNKVFKSGILNVSTVTADSNKADSITATLFDENGEKVAVLDFDSIGQASKVLCIDKSNIVKVLKGKRKTANNYSFEYKAQ